MPIYEYRCQDCHGIETTYRTVEKREDAPECHECGGRTRKIISLSYNVHGDLDPYYDDNLETYITSKQHRRRVMEEKGLAEHFGQGWHTSAKKHRKVG